MYLFNGETAPYVHYVIGERTDKPTNGWCIQEAGTKREEEKENGNSGKGWLWEYQKQPNCANMLSKMSSLHVYMWKFKVLSYLA